MGVRRAWAGEFESLRDIERASGEPFRDHGMPEIADDDPMPLRTLHELHVWVATAGTDRPVAWVAVNPLRDSAHVEQISVHPDHARRGIGAALLDHVDEWAARQGFDALTLTTFRDVPWNAPYYLRLGFHEVGDPAPELRGIIEEEAARGLDPATRVCLLRPTRRGRSSAMPNGRTSR